MIQRMLRGLIITLVALLASQSARAADGTPAIVEKAIKALGGEEQLSKIKGVEVRGKGTINLMGNESPFNVHVIFQDLEHTKQDFEGDFGGMKIKGTMVLAGNKGWRGIAGMMMDLEGDALAEAKRSVYLQVVPMTLVQLKGKGFKVESAPNEMVDGKNAIGLKITAPDSKTFLLYIDEASSLPVKMVAKVKDFQGDEFTQTNLYSDYKEFQGIKKATKTESKRDGEKFQNQEVTEFKILDSVDPKTFAEPKD